MKRNINKIMMCILALLAVSAHAAFGAETPASPVFSQEELDQIVAPVALYPDALLSQILMASTYPLQVVEAQRWAEKNKTLQGDALTTALEGQNWDPSVKSLVNFPDVLAMMNEKLDWTQKLGDAVLAQQQDVMRSIQDLRKKAEEQGNLKTTEQQIVTVEKETIIIQPADPQVVYVPAYNPTVVYGTWPYPSYPPYYYNPPWYATATPYAFGAGLAIGAAWGYAWGDCDWNGGDIDIDVNRNTNINQNINRGKYAQQYGQHGQLDGNRKGSWQHNPQNRKGVPYRDQTTAQRYNRGASADAVKSREAFRGRADQGRQDISGGAADRYKGQGASRQSARPQTRDMSTGGSKGSRDLSSRSGTSQTQRSQGVSQRSGTTKSAGAGTGSSARRQSSTAGSRGSALQGMNSGSSASKYSNRGQSSRSSMSRSSSGGGRSGGGGGGGGRSGGGGGGRR